MLWLAGFLAIVGSPPFGPFISELTILKGASTPAGRSWPSLYLLALAIVFVGMAAIFLRMVYGQPPAVAGAAADGSLAGMPRREPLWSVAPPLRWGCGARPGSLRAAATDRPVATGGRRLGSQLMSSDPLLVVHNGHAFPWPIVRVLPIEEFRQRCDRARRGRRRGWRRCSHIAARPGSRATAGRARPAPGGRLGGRRGRGGRSIPGPNARLPAGPLFEREIFEQWNVRPLGHPWLKPVRSRRRDVRGTLRGQRPHAARPTSSRWPARRSTRWPSARYMPASSSRATFASSATAKRSTTWKFRWAISIAAWSGRCIGGPDPRTIHYTETLAGDTHRRPCDRLLPRRRGPERRPAFPPGARSCAAWPWNWSGWPTTSAIWALWPATWAFCRRSPIADAFAATC